MNKTVYPLARTTLSDDGKFAGPVAFSNGVKVSGGDLLFISGQLAFDGNMELTGKGDMGAQTRQVLNNIAKVLDQAGGTFQDIVRVTVYVKDISRFREIHDARLEFFDAEHLPASTMVEISEFVHDDALIEIDAIAVIAGS
ncbi:MAG: RidA family protein [Candidatus Glassbacteria bacterium]|nr:RidA family protein [Candidatus Glassbacteria bacterium]